MVAMTGWTRCIARSIKHVDCFSERSRFWKSSSIRALFRWSRQHKRFAADNVTMTLDNVQCTRITKMSRCMELIKTLTLQLLDVVHADQKLYLVFEFLDKVQYVTGHHKSVIQTSLSPPFPKLLQSKTSKISYVILYRLCQVSFHHIERCGKDHHDNQWKLQAQSRRQGCYSFRQLTTTPVIGINSWHHQCWNCFLSFGQTDHHCGHNFGPNDHHCGHHFGHHDHITCECAGFEEVHGWLCSQSKVRMFDYPGSKQFKFCT